MDQPTQEVVGESWKYNPDYHKMTDFLGVDVYDRDKFEIANKVSFLADWAAEKGAKDFDQALGQINRVKKETGSQLRGKSLVNELYHYVRLMKAPAQTKVATPFPKVVPKAKTQPKNDMADVISQSVQKMTAPLKKTVNEAVKNSVNTMIQDSLKEMIK